MEPRFGFSGLFIWQGVPQTLFFFTDTYRGYVVACHVRRPKTLSAMRATVQALSAQGRYSKTENNILLVFTIHGSEFLAVGDDIEVDLPTVLASQQVLRVNDKRAVRIQLAPDNIHDLDLSVEHGTSRTPSSERMHGT